MTEEKLELLRSRLRIKIKRMLAGQKGVPFMVMLREKPLYTASSTVRKNNISTQGLSTLLKARMIE